jgi:hypothetical protein
MLRTPVRRAFRALLPILLWAAPVWADAAPEAGAVRRGALPVGAYCTPASCRNQASPWMAAAFGAAVLVIHRSARRRPLR